MRDRARYFKEYRQLNKTKLYKQSAIWAVAHPQAIALKNKRQRNKRLEILHNLIRDAKKVSCADCKIPYAFYIMDFDHVRGVKKYNLSQFRGYSIPFVITEIAKCDIVCANCHRRRTYERLYER